MRVCAEKGTKLASLPKSSCSRMPYCLASTTIERPSGGSSASEESCAASARSASLTPGMGMNSEAKRLPIVIVPVLSSSSTSTSPEASTARPHHAIHTGDANRAQERPDRGGDQRHEQRDQSGLADGRPSEQAEGAQCRHH